MSLSRERVVAAKARADAATEGPWVMVTQGGIESAHYRGPGEDTNSVAQTRNQEDWEFITAAREDVPVMADALLRVLDREAVARAIRDRVRLGPIGPNSVAIIESGGRVSLTASEADDAADAVLDVLYGVDGSSSNTERSEQ